MSDWIHVTGYMVVGDDVPCKIGKKYKEDMENDMTPTGEICGSNVSLMLGKILVTLRNKWKYFCDKPYNPFGYHGRILWKVPYMNCCGEWERDDEEEEWFIWEELKLDDGTNLLEALQFPCGSEGPLDLTVIPHIGELGTSWHIVFDGNLRDRDSSYFDKMKIWWKAIQQLLNVYSGYICCTWLDEKWKDEI